MSQNSYFAVTSSESVTLHRKGKDPLTIKSDNPNFEEVQKRIQAFDYEDIEDLMVEGIKIANWSAGQFEFKDNVLKWTGKTTLPEGLQKRLELSLAEGVVPKNLLAFWDLLQQNVSNRAIKELFSFIEHKDISIGSSGYLFAYKGVREDYRDSHSGTFVNKPGSEFSMDRRLVSDDPREACKAGFHVGSMAYVKSFGKRVVLCRIDPRDIVCIPYDSNRQKVRCCRYVVVDDWEKDKVLPMEFDDAKYWKEQPKPEWWDDVPATLHTKVVAPVAEAPAVVEGAPPAADAVPNETRVTSNEELVSELVTDALKWNDMTLAALRPLAKEEFGVKNVKAVRGGKPALIDRLVQIRITGDPVDHDVAADPKHAAIYQSYLKAFSLGQKVAEKATHLEKATKGKKSKAPGSEWTEDKTNEWGSMDAMTDAELFANYTLERIRIYANKHLGILNIKGIRGGKVGLMDDPRWKKARSK